MSKKSQLVVRIGGYIFFTVIVGAGMLWIYRLSGISYKASSALPTKTLNVLSAYPAPGFITIRQTDQAQGIYPPPSIVGVDPTEMTPVNNKTPSPSAVKTLSIEDVQKTSLENAKTAFDNKDAQFVDVRSSSSYASSHIPGAISIPEDQISENLSKLDPNRWIITYCS